MVAVTLRPFSLVVTPRLINRRRKRHERCLFIGGLHGAGVDTSLGGAFLEGRQWHGGFRISPPAPPDLTGTQFQMSLADGPGSLFAWSKYVGGTFAGGPYNLRYYSDYGYVMEYGNGYLNWSSIITPPEGNIFRAPRISSNRQMFPFGAYFGNYNTGVAQLRMVQFAADKPAVANVQYVKGDIAFDQEGRTAGWMCTRTGVHTATWASGTNYTVGAIMRTAGGHVYQCTAVPYDPDGWTTPPSTVRPTHSIATGLQHYPEPNPHIDPGEAATIPGYTWEAFDSGLPDYPDWVSGAVLFPGYGFTDPTTHISYWIQKPPQGDGMPVQPPPIFNTPWAMPTSTVAPTHTTGTARALEPNPSPSGTEPATIPGHQWLYLSSDPTPEWKTFGSLQGNYTTSVSDPLEDQIQIWTNAAVTFVGKTVNYTDTASHADSVLQEWRVNGAQKVAIRKDGMLLVNGEARTGVVKQTTPYTVTGVTPDRAIDPSATATEIAHVLGTLIEDLKLAGVIT